MGNDLFRAMLRGFGFTAGRRAASALPLWAAVALIVILYLLGK
jgi:hypothetical protein